MITQPIDVVQTGGIRRMERLHRGRDFRQDRDLIGRHQPRRTGSEHEANGGGTDQQTAQEKHRSTALRAFGVGRGLSHEVNVSIELCGR